MLMDSINYCKRRLSLEKLFIKDRAQSVLQNVSHAVPNINNNLKSIRCRFNNLKSQIQSRDHVAGIQDRPRVPTISVIPPSPVSPEPLKKGFSVRNLDTRLVDVLGKYRERIRRHSLPSNQSVRGGVNGPRNRRHSLPCVPTNNLLQVPTFKKNKRRKRRQKRTSLPSVRTEALHLSFEDDLLKKSSSWMRENNNLINEFVDQHVHGQEVLETNVKRTLSDSNIGLTLHEVHDQGMSEMRLESGSTECLPETIRTGSLLHERSRNIEHEIVTPSLVFDCERVCESEGDLIQSFDHVLVHSGSVVAHRVPASSHDKIESPTLLTSLDLNGNKTTREGVSDCLLNPISKTGSDSHADYPASQLTTAGQMTIQHCDEEMYGTSLESRINTYNETSSDLLSQSVSQDNLCQHPDLSQLSDNAIKASINASQPHHEISVVESSSQNVAVPVLGSIEASSVFNEIAFMKATTLHNTTDCDKENDVNAVSECLSLDDDYATSDSCQLINDTPKALEAQDLANEESSHCDRGTEPDTGEATDVLFITPTQQSALHITANTNSILQSSTETLTDCVAIGDSLKRASPSSECIEAELFEVQVERAESYTNTCVSCAQKNICACRATWKHNIERKSDNEMILKGPDSGSANRGSYEKLLQIDEDEEVSAFDSKGLETLANGCNQGSTESLKTSAVSSTCSRRFSRSSSSGESDVISECAEEEDGCINEECDSSSSENSQPPSEGENHSALGKASSLTRLDMFMNRSKSILSPRRARPHSLHQVTLQRDPETDEMLASLQLVDKENDRRLQEQRKTSDDRSYSMEELKRVMSPHRFNKKMANDMFRKAVSLCELQNVKLRENISRLEQKFSSLEGISKADCEETEEWFPRLSYEDCSSCASCRSRSSSYHSLLYDQDVASSYPIYQPTVCDVADDTEAPELDVTPHSNIPKTKKERLIKSGQIAFGSFKEKLRRAKSKT